MLQNSKSLGQFGVFFVNKVIFPPLNFKMNIYNKLKIALRVVQFWSEIKLVITNRTPASGRAILQSRV